jgi:mannose-1-phosphate guanylyltransferase
MLHSVIMAGGSGTRFWPQSRKNLPKQFLNFTGEATLIRQTVARCGDWISPARTWIVTGASHASETQRQVPAVPIAQVLVEPAARNTAPCVGIAAIQLAAIDPSACMLVMPADHVIKSSSEFVRAAQAAAEFVDQKPARLMLFGVKPTFPSTGFGYMQRGAQLPGNTVPAYDVAAFKEKPDLATAQTYLSSGQYYWNCGIFIWRAATILDALATFEPEMYRLLMELAKHVGRSTWTTALAELFPQMPSISIDYAVLERADDVCVIEAPFDWDDVGSWQAMPRLKQADSHDNVVDGLHVGVETTGCIIRTSSEHLVTTIGVKDLIVVHTPTATLVADKHDESSIRILIQKLKDMGLEGYL